MVYLVGLIITPLGGVWISRVGSQAALMAAVGLASWNPADIGPDLPVIPSAVLCSSECLSASRPRRVTSSAKPSRVGAPLRRPVRDVLLHRAALRSVAGMLWRYGQWKACVR